MLVKVEPKGNLDLYTLIDVTNGDKIVSLGGKATEDLELFDIIDVWIRLVLKEERIETKTEGIKFLNVGSIFINNISKSGVDKLDVSMRL